MDLYSPIFTRASTRKYDPTPLPADTLQQIESFIAGVTPLLPDAQITYQIVGPDAVKGLALPDAPHFFVISGKPQPLRNACAGFLFQYVDLYLYAIGLASRWLGTAKPKQDDPNFIIGKAFGTPAEPATRTFSQFDRKPLTEIADGTDPRLEAVRLAPSGLNGQPWHFIVDGTSVHAYYKKSLGGVIGMTYHLTDLDIGIALAHMAVATDHEARPFRFTSVTNPPAPPKGFLYIGTVE